MLIVVLTLLHYLKITLCRIGFHFDNCRVINQVIIITETTFLSHNVAGTQKAQLRTRHERDVLGTTVLLFLEIGAAVDKLKITGSHQPLEV